MAKLKAPKIGRKTLIGGLSKLLDVTLRLKKSKATDQALTIFEGLLCAHTPKQIEAGEAAFVRWQEKHLAYLEASTVEAMEDRKKPKLKKIKGKGKKATGAQYATKH